VQVAGPNVLANGCKFLRNGTIGAFINNGSSCTFIDCALHSNRLSGSEVCDRLSSLVTTNTTFANNGRVGVYTHSAAHTELVKCELSGNRAFEILCGGRQGADIGGGTTTYCIRCNVAGKMLARHAARIFKAVPEEARAGGSSSIHAGIRAEVPQE
jgi:hypothetical protein